jgi:hypothetical protein
METDFSTLQRSERVAMCLLHAESARDRANACEDGANKQLHLSLAECWLSLARNFETIAELVPGAPRPAIARPAKVEPPVMRELDLSLPMQLKGFAV